MPQGFNPRARVGRDINKGAPAPFLDLFQSTRPRGARLVGKLAAMGVYQKADQPRPVGGSKRVPKMTQIRAMAAKLDAIGIADALEKLEPIEVANSSVIGFVSDLVDRLVSAQAGSAE